MDHQLKCSHEYCIFQQSILKHTIILLAKNVFHYLIICNGICFTNQNYYHQLQHAQNKTIHK
jgi:hypothetical protein